jgi:Fe-S-cluster containining protein
MSCFDCKKMHHKCKAQCCGIVPIPKSIYEECKDKIVRTPLKLLEGEETVLPITEDALCVFLNEDLTCNIYDKRPIVCEIFGDESHPMLTCPVLDKHGNERSRQDQRRKEQQSQKFIKNFMNS